MIAIGTVDRVVVLHEKALHSAGMSQWIGLELRPGAEPAIGVARKRDGAPAGGLYMPAGKGAIIIETACAQARAGRSGIAGVVPIRGGASIEVASMRVVILGVASVAVQLTLIGSDGGRRRPTVLHRPAEIAALDAAAHIALEAH